MGMWSAAKASPGFRRTTAANSTFAFCRYGSAHEGADHSEELCVVDSQLHPHPPRGLPCRHPPSRRLSEILNSDSELYGGGNIGNAGLVQSDTKPMHGREQSVLLTLPPLSCVVLHAE